VIFGCRYQELCRVRNDAVDKVGAGVGLDGRAQGTCVTQPEIGAVANVPRSPQLKPGGRDHQMFPTPEEYSGETTDWITSSLQVTVPLNVDIGAVTFTESAVTLTRRFARTLMLPAASKVISLPVACRTVICWPPLSRTTLWPSLVVMLSFSAPAPVVERTARTGEPGGQVTSWSEFVWWVGDVPRPDHGEPTTTLALAVRAYFAQGGRTAWVLRVAPAAPGEASAGFAAADRPALRLDAANEGSWGNSLSIMLEFVVSLDFVTSVVAVGRILFVDLRFDG
jgi:hypothetical protein